MKRFLSTALAGLLIALAVPAHADAVDALRDFVKGVASGRASFSQVVTSPDGAKKKTSTGNFEFQRPNRFRFDYAKPYEQQIVSDGAKVWFLDTDLNQVTVRPFDQAVGSTPAALLAGGDIERDFSLQAEPDQGGLQWVRATPRAAASGEGGSIRSLRVGFNGKLLAAVEITDGFGQRSRLDFSRFESGAALAPARFRFVPPAGADVLQP